MNNKHGITTRVSDDDEEVFGRLCSIAEDAARNNENFEKWLQNQPIIVHLWIGQNLDFWLSQTTTEIMLVRSSDSVSQRIFDHLKEVFEVFETQS